MKRWQHVNGIYQIYPRSFKDSNDDGTGDIPGIIEKLDYIKSGNATLGIDAIWLSPFYPSPMADFGYDVADYKNVDPMFGTLDDFKRLLSEAHARDIKVMIDFVPNHTSDEHEWFRESKSSRTSAKRDWYIWQDPRADGTPPNNWLSVFGGSAWELDKASGQYYLHSFLAKQPDLNWDNPEVRAAMADMLRFWLDMGVDGIRADAVRWMSKDPAYQNNPLNADFVEGNDPYFSQRQKYSRYGENLFAYLKELSDVIEEYDDRIILFEDYPDPWIDLKSQYSHFYAVNPHVAAPFNFQGFGTPYSSKHFRDFISKFQTYIGSEERPFYCFGNHDNPRLVSRMGRPQAKLIGMLQLTLPGTPVIYYGDEIGMENVPISPEFVHDPFEKQTPGLGLGRDPERTPMQWSQQQNAGFTRGNPWLPVANNYAQINVETEFGDSGSFLRMYHALLKLRRLSVLRFGTYEEWMGSNDQLFGFFRQDSKGAMFVLLNMSDEPVAYNGDVFGLILYSTHAIQTQTIDGPITLQAHQGVIIDCSI